MEVSGRWIHRRLEEFNFTPGHLPPSFRSNQRRGEQVCKVDLCAKLLSLGPTYIYIYIYLYRASWPPVYDIIASGWRHGKNTAALRDTMTCSERADIQTHNRKNHLSTQIHTIWRTYILRTPCVTRSECDSVYVIIDLFETEFLL